MQEENDLTYHCLRRARTKIKKATNLLVHIGKRKAPAFYNAQTLPCVSDLNEYVLACELREIFQLLREARARVSRMKFLFKKQPETTVQVPEGEQQPGT